MVIDLIIYEYYKLKKFCEQLLKTILIADDQFKYGSQIYKSLLDAGIASGVYSDVTITTSQHGYVLQYIFDIPSGRLKIGVNKHNSVNYVLEMYKNGRTSYIGECGYTYDQFTCALPSIIHTCESLNLNFFKNK